MGRNMCLSLSAVGKKIGGLGMVSTFSAIALSKQSALGQLFDSNSDLTQVKQEGQNIRDEGNQSERNSSEKSRVDILSKGLVFAGSRMGDSILMMYGMKE